MIKVKLASINFSLKLSLRDWHSIKSSLNRYQLKATRQFLYYSISIIILKWGHRDKLIRFSLSVSFNKTYTCTIYIYIYIFIYISACARAKCTKQHPNGAARWLIMLSSDDLGWTSRKRQGARIMAAGNSACTYVCIYIYMHICIYKYITAGRDNGNIKEPLGRWNNTT